jgi:hypothetical protein
MNYLKKYILENGVISIINNYAELQLHDIIQIIDKNADDFYYDKNKKILFENIFHFDLIIYILTKSCFLIIQIYAWQNKISVYKFVFEKQNKEYYIKLLEHSAIVESNCKFIETCIDLYNCNAYSICKLCNTISKLTELYKELEKYKIEAYNIKIHTNSVKSWFDMPTTNTIFLNNSCMDECMIKNIFPEKILQNITVRKKLNKKRNKVLVAILIKIKYYINKSN